MVFGALQMPSIIISHNVLYYQQLPIDQYQVRFYANIYFEELPIVSSAFDVMTTWIVLQWAQSTADDKGMYQCRVWNKAGCITSKTVAITVGRFNNSIKFN